jgi:hypothetical protein
MSTPVQFLVYKYTVKPAYMVTSIKQSPVLKGLFLSCLRKFHISWTSFKRSPVLKDHFLFVLKALNTGLTVSPLFLFESILSLAKYWHWKFIFIYCWQILLHFLNTTILKEFNFVFIAVHIFKISNAGLVYGV